MISSSILDSNFLPEIKAGQVYIQTWFIMIDGIGLFLLKYSRLDGFQTDAV